MGADRRLRVAGATIALAVALAWSPAAAREIFVAKSGSDAAVGDAAHPFLTIQRAAQVAQPGDIVTVRAGLYRERIDPARGGTSERKRIVYRAAPGEEVKIVGSEPVTGWEKAGYYWRAVVPAHTFGSFNPFASPVKHPATGKQDTDEGWGWLRYGRWTHRGDLYFNGEGFTEAETEAGLARPMTWRAEVNADGTTTITANFSDKDPNQGAVEINVRPTIFFPSKPGLSYITVRGFTMMNAAPHWAPPVPDQLAALGPNGGHHWIIEDNRILYSKASCISLGDPSGPADPESSGHHIVRRNVLMRCGQAGIVGMRWHKNSRISDNVIEDTNYRYEFGGAETGAIKLHFARDIVIEHNLIRRVGSIDPNHSNGDGIWLDVGATNVAIKNNVLVDVDANAILMEANCEGPVMIENNVVVGGRLATFSSKNLYWKNNLFVQTPTYWVNQTDLGRSAIEDLVWIKNIYVGVGATGKRLPAEAGLNERRQGNLYLGNARPGAGEQDALVSAVDPQFRMDLEGPEVTVHFVIDEAVVRAARSGSGLDFYDKPRTTGSFALGPFASVNPGRNALPLFAYGANYRAAQQALRCGAVCSEQMPDRD